MVRLVFSKTRFLEDKTDGDAFLDLDEGSQKANLTFPPNAGLVSKRMATRQARSICATGYQLMAGNRIGSGFLLEVQGETSISEVLLQEGHKYQRM